MLCTSETLMGKFSATVSTPTVTHVLNRSRLCAVGRRG